MTERLVLVPTDYYEGGTLVGRGVFIQEPGGGFIDSRNFGPEIALGKAAYRGDRICPARIFNDNPALWKRI